MKLSAITLISNGEFLKYPYKECIANLCEQVDEVTVNVDLNSNDNTFKETEKLFKQYDNLYMHYNYWDFRNTGDGSELAKQANALLEHITGDWIIYLQADEFLHHDDIVTIRNLCKKLPAHFSQIELWRTYFWGDLKHRAPQNELYLGRIFRKETHQIGGDGMYLIRQKGEVYRTDIPIYHYSRIGTEKEITKRIRKLDLLFHEKEKVKSFQDFSFQEMSNLVEYKGKHPQKIKEFYGEK